MVHLRSILSLLALGSVVVKSPVPDRLIKKIACVLGMVFLCSMLIGALLLAASVYGYNYLVAQGYEPMESGVYVLCGMLALIVLAVSVTAQYADSALDELKASLKKSVPLTTHLTNEVGSIVEAFFKGLMDPPKR